jgi:hypothetical protein
LASSPLQFISGPYLTLVLVTNPSLERGPHNFSPIDPRFPVQNQSREFSSLAPNSRWRRGGSGRLPPPPSRPAPMHRYRSSCVGSPIKRVSTSEPQISPGAFPSAPRANFEIHFRLRSVSSYNGQWDYTTSDTRR